MHQAYHDITGRLGEPLWWDEGGVPRYEAFGPMLSSDIYAQEVALLDIACQNCGRHFAVAMSCSPWDMTGHDARSLADTIRDGTIHYGDPPNFACCPAGPTMNCEDLAVLQYWHYPDIFKWERNAELEGPLPGAEAQP